MIKDEALKMAIKTLQGLCETFMPQDEWVGVEAYDITVNAIDTCKEALESLDDQYDIELKWYSKGWDDALKEKNT
jgi:hypothetical protein